LERYLYERPREKASADALQTFVEGILAVLVLWRAAPWAAKTLGAPRRGVVLAVPAGHQFKGCPKKLRGESWSPRAWRASVRVGGASVNVARLAQIGRWSSSGCASEATISSAGVFRHHLSASSSRTSLGVALFSSRHLCASGGSH